MSTTSVTVPKTSARPQEFLSPQEPTTRWRDVFLHTQALDVEAWHETLHSSWGRYNPVVNDPKTFVAKIRAQNVYGITAMHLMPNASRVERTQRDARIDGMDHYYAMFSVAGTVTVIQNDQAVELVGGQVLLVDSARSVTYVGDPRHEQRSMPATDMDRNNYRQCFVLQLPRESLLSHLGFEPQYGPGVRWNTRAGQVFFKLVGDAVDGDEPTSVATDSYMRLVIYDLIGAIFSPSDPVAFSRTDKLFKRVCYIVEGRFRDPNLTPDDVAAEAGISRRYLQKLFAMRNLTYTHFVNSVRLDHAALLLQRRVLLGTIQPISTIAYTCGFNNYANFSKQFRIRFGHAPGAHARSS
jgi:AraC family transcriptional regulator, positive regulator of tynA and feaB